MGMKAILKSADKKLEKKLDELPGEAQKKVEEKVTEKVRENVIGGVCTWMFSSEKNQNRCKALKRLPDIAENGAKAIGTCTAAAGANTATVGTGGAAAPVGIVTTLSCGYYTAKTADSTGAMFSQLKSGEEVKTLEEQGKEMGGAWVKKKWDAGVERQLNEIATSDYRHAKKLDPDLTPAAHNRLQNYQNAIDDGSFFE